MLRRVLSVIPGDVRSVDTPRFAYSPHGTLAAHIDDYSGLGGHAPVSGQVSEIDIQPRREVLNVPKDDMVDAAFGSDGRVLYVARTDGVIGVREAPAWEVARSLSYSPGNRPTKTVGITVAPGRESAHGHSRRRSMELAHCRRGRLLLRGARDGALNVTDLGSAGSCAASSLAVLYRSSHTTMQARVRSQWESDPKAPTRHGPT